MAFYLWHCCECKNVHEELKDGWRLTCDAFPEGIPREYVKDFDVRKIAECKNGIKYEHNDIDFPPLC